MQIFNKSSFIEWRFVCFLGETAWKDLLMEKEDLQNKTIITEGGLMVADKKFVTILKTQGFVIGLLQKLEGSMRLQDDSYTQSPF